VDVELLHGFDDVGDGSREDVLVAEGRAGTEGGEDYIGSLEGVANGVWVEGTALDDFDAITERKGFGRTQKSGYFVTGCEGTLGEEAASASVGSEDGYVHREALLLAGLIILAGETKV
jgi:hypothetical protein